MKNLLHFVAHNAKMIMGYKIGGEKLEPKKAGRPTDNPKTKPIHVRLDAECEMILDKYCKQENLSKAEGIRVGIRKLGNDLEK